MGESKYIGNICIIDDLASCIADDIMKRDVGSRATIKEIANELLELEGYNLVYQEDAHQWVWKNKKDEIYPLEYYDLIKVLNLVKKKLRKKRMLDFSEHGNLDEGLPFNFEFIIIKTWRDKIFRPAVRE